MHIPAISRWKMIDNLRRTLSPPCIFHFAADRLDVAALLGLDVDRIYPAS